MEISVWVEELLQKQVLVRPDGGISFPFADNVQAKGRTISDVSGELKKKINKFVPDAVVTVSLVQNAGNRIYVLGRVNKPGEFLVPRPVDVMQALAMAGGLTPFADRDTIRVLAPRRRGAAGHRLQLRAGGTRRGPRAEHPAPGGRRDHGALSRPAAPDRARRAMRGNPRARTHRQGRRPPAVAVALAVAALGAAADIRAEDLWYNQPRVSVGALYNDNIGLSASDTISSFGAQAQAGIRGGSQSQTTDVGVTGTLAGTTYFDASGYDSTSAGLALDAAHQRERNRFGLGATFSYLPTTASEVDTTGDQQQDSTQLRWSLAPSWSHQLTERATVEVAANYSEASYQGSGSGLNDYQNLGGCSAATT